MNEMDENRVTAKEIEEEIFAMMKDIFVGKMELSDGIKLTLLNGQSFLVNVQEA